MPKSHKASWMLIALCIILMQAHAIPFWQSITGEYIGIAWSVVTELVALWLWYHKEKALAFFASLIVIIGPLGELSFPILEDIRKAQATSKHLEIFQTDAKRSDVIIKDLVKYKWAGNYKKESTYLNGLRADQHQAIDTQSTQREPWQNYIIIAFQALALIIAWLTQIKAINKVAVPPISKSKTKPEIEPETKPPSISTISETPETPSKQPTERESFAQTLISRFERYMTDHTYTQGNACNELDVSSSDISKLRNIIKREGEPATSNIMSKVNNQLKEKGY